MKRLLGHDERIAEAHRIRRDLDRHGNDERYAGGKPHCREQVRHGIRQHDVEQARGPSKFENARNSVPKPELVRNDGNDVGIIAYGTSHHALVETLDQLQSEQGIKADYLRLRAYPFTSEVGGFISAHKRIYVVDQNRDGQMFQLLKLDIPAEEVVRLRSVRHYNGLPLDARSVTDEIVSQEGK